MTETPRSELRPHVEPLPGGYRPQARAAAAEACRWVGGRWSVGGRWPVGGRWSVAGVVLTPVDPDICVFLVPFQNKIIKIKKQKSPVDQTDRGAQVKGQG